MSLIAVEPDKAVDAPRSERDEEIVCMAALLESLMKLVPSNDVWYIARASARGRCLDAGMEAGRVDEAMARIESSRASRRARNPMSSMFA